MSGPDPPSGPGANSGPDPGSGRPSGLRNPGRAVRGLGAGTLILEALVLLLAIQPIRLLGGDLSGVTIAVIVAFAVLCVVLAGRLGKAWSWPAATVLQGLLMLSALLHWSLGLVGLIFGLVWVFVLHIRRSILGATAGDAGGDG